MTNEQKLEQIKKMKIVPVVVLNTLEETLPKMQALIDGGLPCAEITFRTACAILYHAIFAIATFAGKILPPA